MARLFGHGCVLNHAAIADHVAMNEFTDATQHRSWLHDQAALPAGFQVGTATFDFTPVELDTHASMTLSLVVADQPCTAFAAVFTQNAFPGAPVRIGRERLDQSPALQALVINNKISNVCAPNGVQSAESVCAAVADAIGCDQTAVLPSSTGIIGWQIPAAAMIQAIPQAQAALQSHSIVPLAEGIMTTDLFPKVRRVDLPGGGSIVGVAKGAGMIEPNMATMLAYVLTDVAIERDDLQQALVVATATSFNAISIDTDQSTSDTVVALSSQQVNGVSVADFTTALTHVCEALAEDLVRNGEGVQHVMKVTVAGAPSEAIAKGVGKAIVNSPLVQCAVCGNDPNVGRLIMAIGKYLGNEHPAVSTDAVTITIGDTVVYRDGAFHLDQATEETLSQLLESAQLYKSAPPDENGVFRPPVTWPPHERVVPITVDLGVGQQAFTVTGNDRTHEYISENADYRS